jgi:hypothetical protein
MISKAPGVNKARAAVVSSAAFPESIAVATLFGIAMALFSSVCLFNCLTIGNEAAPLEKRKMASFQNPHFRDLSNLARFPSSFERFFDDRLAFRLPLISNRAFLRYRLFNIGTDSVLVGRHGWLFYREGVAIDYLRNDKPLNVAQTRWWAKYFDTRREWCEKRGIKYLVYVPPISSTIYPEMIPDGIRCSTNPSRMDQVFSFLAKSTSVRFVDLRPPLLAAKTFPIYLKTDTHWNHLGAFLATGEVLKALRSWFPNLTTLSWRELDLERANYSGDLLGLIGAGDKITEATLRQKHNGRKLWKCTTPLYDVQDLEHRTPFATEVDDPKLPTAVCIRDSFTIAQREYLSNHFRRILYGWWDDFPYDVIEREHPDVVLQEKCERMIGR